MFNPESKLIIENNLIKTFTVAIVVHIIAIVSQEKEMLDRNFLILLAGSAIGILVHGFITRKLEKYIKVDEKYREVVSDLVKFSTILLVKQSFVTFMRTGSVNLSPMFLTTVATTLVGYSLFTLFMREYLNQRGFISTFINDAIKVGTAVLLTDFYPDGDIEVNTIDNLLRTYAGLYLHHNK